MTLELTTHVNAPIERLFDLSRSIDAHMESTLKTNERAIAGKTSGLIDLNETVTWEARHLGVKQRLQVKITQMRRPHFFEDEMIKGAFSYMRHRHEFSEAGDCTVMKDHFEFGAPWGPFGRLAEVVLLKACMRKLLEERNRVLKDLAETAKGNHFLNIDLRDPKPGTLTP